MNISTICFTPNGCQVSKKLSLQFLKCYGMNVSVYGPVNSGFSSYGKSIKKWTRDMFQTQDAVIFIGAVGIAVRSIAAYVSDKYSDPAVLVIDEMGYYVIPLLSGHIGGANELAWKISEMIGAVPVVTTATDLNNCFAVDVFARKNGLMIKERDMVKKISTILIKGEKVSFISELPYEGSVPEELDILQEREYGILISPYKIKMGCQKILQLVPDIICLGIGCRKNTDSKVLEDFILQGLERYGIIWDAVLNISSIKQKKEERALLDFSKKYEIPFLTYSAEELEQVNGNFTASMFVKKIVGVDNVCERSAVLSAKNGKLIVKKQEGIGVTFAIAVLEKKIYM